MSAVDGGPIRKLQPGQAAAIWGVVAAAWAVFVLPLFCGAVGIVLGAYAWRRGERRGRWVIVAAVVGLLLGLGLGLLPDKFVSN
jgi:MFS family permease